MSLNPPLLLTADETADLLRTTHSRGRQNAMDELLTVDELAEWLKVPKSWVYEHTRTNCPDPLPSIRLGKYRRFIAADVRRYLQARRLTASDDC